MKKVIRIQWRTVLTSVFATGLLVTTNVKEAGAQIMESENATAYLSVKDGNLNRTYSIAAADTIDNSRNTTAANNQKVTRSTGGCKKDGCSVFAEINKAEQKMYVYVSGELMDTFKVSTGMKGHETPNLDLRPSGPTYRKYTSTKYPEGDYQGLGNMPYAVFLRGGYAIHGTTKGSIPKLGKKASHGCVRLHPDDAKKFYDLVNSVGLENTWVTVY